MYNPKGFELPDYDDPQLTEYIYGYDVLFIHVIGFDSKVHSETPFVEMEFWTPFSVRVPFHFLMWPDTPTIVEDEQLFALDNLNPNGESFIETEPKLLETMGISPEKSWKRSFENWFEKASDEGCDTIAVLRYRVRYEWTVRAWQGLTLAYLEQELDSTEEALEFTRDFSVPEGVVLLETLEPEDREKRPNTLKLQFLAGSFDPPINSFQSRTIPSNQQHKKRGLWSIIMKRNDF
jgi:hypothetical protein